MLRLTEMVITSAPFSTAAADVLKNPCTGGAGDRNHTGYAITTRS